MKRRRSANLNDDTSAAKKDTNTNFTEVEVVCDDRAEDKYFNENLAGQYQPQFLNYQLIGDFTAAMISDAYDLTYGRRYAGPITPKNFCRLGWSVNDLLSEIRSSDSCSLVAKTVLLSLGYNDYHKNSMNALILVETIEKIIQELRRRGCKDIILTNIPPCALDCDSVNHWKFLQIANEEILKLSKKYDFIGHCDIFRLFCTPKNYVSKNKDYVAVAEINYKIDFPLFNEIGDFDEIDLFSFSDLGKKVLSKQLTKAVENRLEYLRHGKIDKIICVLLEGTDDGDKPSDNVQVDPSLEIVKPKESTGSASAASSIIVLDSSDEEDNRYHAFGCSCNMCQAENEQLTRDLLSTIEGLDDCEDENLP